MTPTLPLLPACCRGLLCALACLALGSSLRAAELSAEAVAAQLAAATVTVRMQPNPAEAKAPESKADESKAAETKAVEPKAAEVAPADSAANSAEPIVAATGDKAVTISSGVCVGPGLIVTFVAPATHLGAEAQRFRITLPDGTQAKAELRVVDHYSGLVLLEVPGAALAPLAANDSAPKVGSTVLSAAAAGIEQPAVSQGIVGGVDRSPGSSGLPPLLECDVRTTENSCGAAIVSQQGKLLGIVASTPLPGQRAGWTYAIPARHVERLRAALRPGERVVLERRRPSVGLTMGPGPGEATVVVERVVANGPAHKAGIAEGDLIVEADGRKIRNAYQAVDLILNRQPGDSMSFVVLHDGQRRTVEVTLDGRTPAPGALQTAGEVGPQLKLRVVGRNQIEVQKHVGEAAAGNEPLAARSPGDELEMLKIQLGAFEKVIARLQDELKRRDRQQAETDQVVDSLRDEVDRLRSELPAQPVPSK